MLCWVVASAAAAHAALRRSGGGGPAGAAGDATPRSNAPLSRGASEKSPRGADTAGVNSDGGGGFFGWLFGRGSPRAGGGSAANVSARAARELAAAAAVAAELPLHLAFLVRFHVPGSVDLELCRLGFHVASFEQALGLFREAAAPAAAAGPGGGAGGGSSGPRGGTHASEEGK
jgi:hypothetical protein